MIAASFAFYAVTQTGPVKLRFPADAGNVDDVYSTLSLGVYSSLRTFDHRKFLDLDGHIERTRRSMRSLGWDYELDETRLRHALDAVCENFDAPEMRVRIDVLEAPAQALGHDTRELIGLQAFTPPSPELYREGVSVRIARGLNRADPKVKRASFVQARKAHIPQGEDAYEWLLADDDGYLLEGMSSNFYALAGGVLRTAGKGVLEGITRKIVLEQAALDHVPVELEPIHERELGSLEEAAISSSSRGLMPVVTIDGEPVGCGHPGPVITKLSQAYNDYVRREARPAV